MPTPQKANEPRFLFKCDGHQATEFSIMRFTGSDKISSPYSFEITVTMQDPDLDVESMINKQATLFLQRDEEYYPYSGIITSFRYVETTVDYTTYIITLCPSLWLLSLTIQTRVFQKITIPDIIKKVLDVAELDTYYTFDVQSYPQLEYVVQYQESDLNFINRLMEAWGIWYFFKEPPILIEEVKNYSGPENLMITDKPAIFEDIATLSKIKYRSSAGMVEQFIDEETESIHHIELDRKLIPKEVIVKNYNYRTPEVSVISNQKIPQGDAGTVYEYGGNFKNVTEAQKAATVISHRQAMRKENLFGSSNCAGFRAGSRFTLEEHVRESLNGMYVLTKVIHKGSHPNFLPIKNEKTYSNEFTCISSNQATLFAPEKTAELPKVNGIMTAFIEGQGSKYAALDDTGRYKVRMPYDRSGIANYDASKYVRLAQPYSGQDYGMHFPSHEGAEMIVGHIDGDPDKPLGLGTVPNASTISPVKSTNKEKSTIRTAAGNEIIMDDTEKKERIAVFTPHDLSFTAKNDETISISHNRSISVGNDESDSVKNNMTLTVDKNYTQTIKTNKTIVVDGTHTETIKGATSIKVTSGTYEHKVETGSATISVKGAVTEKFEANQDTTVTNDISLKSSTSSIHLTAATDITLEVGASKLVMKADGTIEINGVKMAISALDVGIKGTGSVNIAGGVISSEATTINTVKGASVMSDGSAVNTIKGGVVMLNP